MNESKKTNPEGKKAPRLFDLNTLHGRLRTLMYRYDVRQKTIAEDIGVTPTAVTRWMKHDGGIKYEHAQALGKYFNVSPRWIMEGGNESEMDNPSDTPPPLSSIQPYGETEEKGTVHLFDYGSNGWKQIGDENDIVFPDLFFLRHGAKPEECVRTAIREASQLSPFKQWDIVTVHKEKDGNPKTVRVITGNFYLVSVDGVPRVEKLSKSPTHLIFEGARPELTYSRPLDEIKDVVILGRIIHLEREIFAFS